jgi:membrane protease YdiL (CAAX protease family)
MRKFIEKISSFWEIIIVLLIGFGLPIYTSTISFLKVNSDYTISWTYKLTSQGHYSIIIFEIVALALIVYFLKLRGWKKEDFNLEFTLKLIWTGLLIMFVKNIISNGSYKVFEYFNVLDKSTAEHVQFGLEANWISILLIVIINSFYEEFILIGYLFKRLHNLHPYLVILISLIIRESYHTYQGWMSLIVIIPIGLVFGYYYAKHRKLWPVIFAHAFTNLIIYVGMYFKLKGKLNL